MRELEANGSVHGTPQPDPDGPAAPLVVGITHHATAKHGHKSKQLVVVCQGSQRQFIV